MDVIFKKSKQLTSYALRFAAFSTKEKRLLTKLKYLLAIIIIKKRNTAITGSLDDEINFQQISSRLKLLLVRFSVCFIDKLPRRVARRHFGILDFSDSDCYKKFKIRKVDLYRVKVALKFGDSFEAGNRAIFTGEEIMLIGLARFSSTGSYEVVLKQIFQLEYSLLSRATSLFVKHILDNFAPLLTGGRGLAFWKPFFAEFALKICNKLVSICPGYAESASFRVALFHDATVLASLRPGNININITKRWLHVFFFSSFPPFVFS